MPKGGSVLGRVAGKAEAWVFRMGILRTMFFEYALCSGVGACGFQV